jgi:hypothetical protein
MRDKNEGQNMKLNIATGRFIAVFIGVLLIALAGIARATLVEGFESGSFSGSEATSGDVGIRGTYFTIAPTQGTKQMLMTTINNTNDSPQTNQSGTNAVSVTTIASFLGVSTSSIRDGTATGQEGSAFTINLGTLTAGSVITLNYDFLTNEIQPGAHNDFAFWELNSGTIHVFADTNSVLLHPTNASNTVFGLETGYQTLTINILATASYTLGLGVMDATTMDTSSGLLIDNIQVLVPEPSTVAFAIAGAALLVVLRSRIKRTS